MDLMICKYCYRFIYQDGEIWIDDDSGDSYCESGFINFHFPSKDAQLV